MFLITDVLLVPQNTTNTTADLCEEGLSALGSRLLKEGKVDVAEEILNRQKVEETLISQKALTE